MSTSGDCFIAHAASDNNIAEGLYNCLQGNFRVFLDTRSLQLGDEWDLRLREAQQSSLITVVLISGNTDRAYYQREEIAAAIALARTDRGHRVVPVYLNSEAALSDYIPYGLRLRHGITLSDSVGFAELREALLKLRIELQEDRARDIHRTPISDLSMAIGVKNSSYHIRSRSASCIKLGPSQAYLEEFHAGGPIESSSIPPFFPEFPNLDFKVVNNGHRTVFLTELCFAIASSQLDPWPILVIERDKFGWNALHLQIWNEGWGPVRNLRARFHLTPLLCPDMEPPGNCQPYPYEILVGDFAESTNVDIGFAFRDAGVDLEGLCSRKIPPKILMLR